MKYCIELTIGARGVVPSVFYEWELPDRRDGVPE